MEIILFLSNEILNPPSWELFSPSLPETGHTLRDASLHIEIFLSTTGGKSDICFQLPLELQCLLVSLGQKANGTQTPELLLLPSPWSTTCPAALQPVPAHHRGVCPPQKGSCTFSKGNAQFVRAPFAPCFSLPHWQLHSSCFEVFDSQSTLQLQCSSAEFNKCLKWPKRLVSAWWPLSSHSEESQLRHKGWSTGQSSLHTLPGLAANTASPAWRAHIDFYSSSWGNTQEENYFLLSSSAGVCLAKGLIFAYKFYQYSLSCIIKVTQPPIAWKIL